MPVLAIAATSARLMAETAKRDGFEVLALDVFGDVDTRRASMLWEPIGSASSLCIDEALTLAALERFARRGDVIGWVAGAGFEALPELLRRGAQVFPLVGTAPYKLPLVRDPRQFFGLLDRLHIAHPEIRYDLPDDPTGWLLKDAQGHGGWQVRAARRGDDVWESDHRYFQCAVAGVPMSATFIANGADACVLGFNRLLTQAIGARPFVYAGVVGPVTLPAELARQISQMVRSLASALSLRGLCSLDFMLDRDASREPVQVLEINPRPPASLGLYAARVAGGVMAAHVAACLHATLPTLTEPAPPMDEAVHGSLVVYATEPIECNAQAEATLANWPDAHDLPMAGAHFAAGDPVCSLSAVGSNADRVTQQLQEARRRLSAALDPSFRRQTP